MCEKSAKLGTKGNQLKLKVPLPTFWLSTVPNMGQPFVVLHPILSNIKGILAGHPCPYMLGK